MNIIDVAQEKERLLKEHSEVYCPECNEYWFSIFDRLFFIANGGICYECSPVNEETNRLAENILEIS